MAYIKRFDGRKFEDLRPMSAKVGVISRADGSAMFRIGHTCALAAVYGPRDLHPKFLQNPRTGILRCNYNMMPFSGHGERVRPGGGRRSKELSMVIEQALIPVLNLRDYPNAVVDVFIELPQTDAGTRCAAIVAASMALADAGLQMNELVSAVAVGQVGSQVVADLTYDEEAYEEEPGTTDIPVAVLSNSGKVTLLQLDGEISKDNLKKALLLAKKVCAQISDLQRKALREKYKVTDYEA